MKKFYKNALILILINCFFTTILKAQIPIDCNKFYLHDPPNIYSYNTATSTYATNAIACPAGGIGLAVSNNINSGSPAVTFYTTVSSQYWYYNGSSWTNTGHNCQSGSAVNICGAGPYIYNIDGSSGGKIYRYDGTGNDVLVLSLSNWNGPFDLIGDDNGNFYVLYTNSGFQKLVKYSPSGTTLCTYSLIGLPASVSGAGYAIIGSKLYMSGGAGDFVGIISGTTITFSSLSGLPAGGDFASCPFPQLSSGLTSTGNLTCSNFSSILTATTSVTGPSYSWSGPGVVSGNGTSVVNVNQPGVYTVVVTGSGGACPGASTSTIAISQTGIPPTVSASGSGAVTCNNAATNLSASPSGMNYAWTAPAGSSITSGVNSQNAVASGAGAFTVTITDPIGGCSSTAVVNVATNTTPPVASASTGGAVLTCAVTNITLSGSGGGTYSWSGPGIVSGGNTANPVVNQPGTYNLIVTSASNGCSNSASPATVNVIQNGAIPAANATVSGSLTCTVNSLSLNGSPSSGSTYSWSGPGIVSGGTTTNPVINQPGTYVFNVTNTTSGCSNSAAVTVQQNTSIPSPAINASGNTVLTCISTAITLTATPSSGVSYNWSGPGIVSGNNTANPVVNMPGTYALIVTNSANGCSNSTPVTIAVSQNTTAPIVSVAAAGNGSITCATPNVILNANPTTGVSYSWSGPGIVSGGNTATPSVNQPGNYSVTVTNTSNGCTNIIGAANSVIFVPRDTIKPIATINATTAGSITCTNTVVVISAGTSSTGPNFTYNWSTNTGTISANANTNAPSVTSAGIYTLTVLNTINGCSANATVNITSNVIPPAGVDAGNSALLPCNSTSITLSATSTSTNVIYNWNGPNGYTFTGQNAGNVLTPGLYTLTVTDNITGCSISDTLSVTSQSVSASFNPDHTKGTPPLLVNFTNTSVDAASYSWNFNDGNTSSLVNPSNTFVNSGTYTVVLTAINASGTCSDTATVIIIVEDELFLEIPNVFTPNNDNTNDLFTIKSTGVKEISLQIFNRWGEKLYEFTGSKAAWDGISTNGANVPDATYFYFVKATGFTDKVIEKSGTVNLFR